MSFVFICSFCGSEYIGLNDIDHSNEGFFCEECDCFTYFENIKSRHKFQLFLEEKSLETSTATCDIHFQKRLSPLRYPGGKIKMLPLLFQSLNKENLQTFVEPFAGGAGAGLALLEANQIQNYILNDVDYGIYALFQTIKTCPNVLIEKIKNFASLNHNDFFEAKAKIQNQYIGCDLTEAAWSLLIANRLSYSGIIKANPLGGKNGTQEQLLSRWNPAELIQRIKVIHSLSHRITVLNSDAKDVIEEYYWSPHTTIFIDPPYYKKGKQLYTHYYNESEHNNLEELLFSLSAGCPGADILLTYDNETFIKDLYWWAPSSKINLHYSV